MYNPNVEHCRTVYGQQPRLAGLNHVRVSCLSSGLRTGNVYPIECVTHTRGRPWTGQHGCLQNTYGHCLQSISPSIRLSQTEPLDKEGLDQVCGIVCANVFYFTCPVTVCGRWGTSDDNRTVNLFPPLPVFCCHV